MIISSSRPHTPAPRSSLPARRTGLWIAVAIGVLGGCSLSASEPYVQFVNGFEFEVQAKLTDASGKETTITVPAKGRVGAELSGAYKAEFIGPKGEITKGSFKIAESKDRKKRCFEYVNVMGSAALIESDIAYGIDIAGSDNLVMGNLHTKVCPRFGLETKEPPEAVTVKDGDLGASLTWLHYQGEGDWHASITHLLSLPPAIDDSYRIQAWNIAFTVSKQDPGNARLAELGPSFLAACNTMQDMFVGTTMEGDGRRKCIKNTQALFAAK